MVGSILQTECMVLVCTILQMDIDMKVVGMKEEGKDLVCILSEMGTLNPGIGKTVFSAFQRLKIMSKLLKQSRYTSNSILSPNCIPLNDLSFF